MPRKKKQISTDGYRKVQELAQRGCTERQIAQALGLSMSTFQKRKKEDQQLTEALALGREVEESALVGALYEQCMKGVSIACMFLLKARHGYREGFKLEHEHNVQVAFQLPAALGKEQYNQAIDVTPETTKEDGDGVP